MWIFPAPSIQFTQSRTLHPINCPPPFYHRKSQTKSKCDAAGDQPIRQYLFLLLNAYGYSRPRLSIRDIITQCGYSVRYRPQAFPLQGNAGRDTRCSPGSFAKHHSDILFWLRLSSMHSARRTGVLRQGGRRVKVAGIRFFHGFNNKPWVNSLQLPLR